MRNSLGKTSIILALLTVVLATLALMDISKFNYNMPAVEVEEYSPPLVSFDHTLQLHSEKEEDEPENIVLSSHALDGAYIELDVPDVLPPESTLVCGVDVLNTEPGLKGLLILHMDNKVVLEEWVVTGSEIPGISHDFIYTRIMQKDVVIKASLKYVTQQGQIKAITTEKTVKIENYSPMHWIDLEAPRVLEEVSSSYKGNYTLQWALDNDYDAFDKEVFVNAMGYESETDYLLWVNRSHQRVNVFARSDDDMWELIEEFLVSTGGRGTATRRGVTKIPSRSAEGWHFEGYYVRPVVRFFPGTGYAFHSRLLRYGSGGGFKDSRIGFPVSAGCIRMYCEDVWYIYDNIPNSTTVVVH